MTVEVMRVQNPAALRLPTIDRLLRTAFTTNTHVENIDEAINELDYWVVRPHAGLFLVRENGSWVSVGFARWGESAFSPYLVVDHVYNEGSREALKALNRALVAYGRLGGYSAAVTLDTNGKGKAFKVLFREGGTPSPIGTAYRFDFDGGANGRVQ